MNLAKFAPLTAAVLFFLGIWSMAFPFSDLSGSGKRGVDYRFLNDGLIEVRDQQSENLKTILLDGPSVTDILAWADTEGVPILEIDPTLIDTSLYEGYYTYWTEVPLSNSYGTPIVVSDVNTNGKPDFYGSFKDFATDIQTHVYELDTSGVPTLMHNYEPRPGISRLIVNADEDSLTEVTFSLGGVVSDFEQTFSGDLPTTLNFAHDMYYNNYSPGFTGIYIGSLDGDSFTDFLYKGSEFDSLSGATSKIYVAEYDADSNNFVRVWSTIFVPTSQSGVGGFSVSDFDQDGLKEFVCSESTTGEIFVVENQRDNEYAQVWQDTVPFVNLYYHGSGDVDRDGKEEFFVGATMSNGNWTLCYEADSNNVYSATFLIKMPPGGFVGGLMYLTSDLDADGDVELMISGAGDLYVLSSDMDNSYGLWYFQPSSLTKSFQTYRFWNDDVNSILISRDTLDALGRSRDFTQVFRPGPVLSVDSEEGKRVREIAGGIHNYPNPFNVSTKVFFELVRRNQVTLKVYDLLGREVARLVDGVLEAGKHEVEFDAKPLSSGMYIYVLKAGGNTISNKMIMVK